MAAWTPPDFLQIPHNGAYGNKSTVKGGYDNLATTTAVALDTYDFVRIPAGATVLSGFLVSTQFTGTSTWVLGVRYADGTSTGGTTGTAILVAGTASSITGTNTVYALRFKPFTNDADAILYATHVSGPAHTANDDATLVVDFIANGTK
jgi:hypothetical protein